MYRRRAKRLNHFYLSCLRKLLKLKWQHKIPYMEVPKKAGMQSMHTVSKLTQLRWTGHVIRLPDERHSKKVFYGDLQEGKRCQGGQKKRYKDTLKASLNDGVLGTDCTGEIKVAKSHQQRSSSLWKNEKSVKLKESSEAQSQYQWATLILFCFIDMRVCRETSLMTFKFACPFNMKLDFLRYSTLRLSVLLLLHVWLYIVISVNQKKYCKHRFIE